MLLCIYALLPLLVVLSRYSLQMLVTGALLIFTVKFWSVLWYLAWWVDGNLFAAMYPDAATALAQAATSGTSSEQLGKRLVLDMITGALYLGLPVLWTGIMGMAGVGAASAIGSATEKAGGSLQGPIDKAGRQGGSVAESAGRGVVKR